MEIGSIVKSIHNNTYGIVRKDKLNFSVHYWSTYDSEPILCKTKGLSKDTLNHYWEVVDELPKTHYIDRFGTPRKRTTY